MTYAVFLSHGGEDTFLVEDYILPKLMLSGADVFLDKGEILFGDDFRAILIDALRSADELVVLLTVTSIERPWVFAEIGAAVVAKKRIVPIRYGPQEEQLQSLGILSLLGNVGLLEFRDLDTYVIELAQRVEERNNV
ncbi:MAG: toll/interleukin-1 receptor domain-containing protein [Pseudomonadota bacterium]